MKMILLAKSTNTPDQPPEQATLLGHTAAVVNVAGVLTSGIGGACFDSTHLPAEMQEDFRQALILSAALHDLGKANDHFQKAVRRTRVIQALRHETISLWLTVNTDLRNWLSSNFSPLVIQAAQLAILGHHLKIEEADCALQPRTGSGDLRLRVYSDDRGFCTVLSLLCNRLNLPPPPAIARQDIDLMEYPGSALEEWMWTAFDWFDAADQKTRLFVALLKAMLVAADVAGSAIARVADKPQAWVQRTLERVCTGTELEQIARDRLAGAEPRPFQKQVARCESTVAFVNAGCGTGKTVAAYLWASRHAVGRKLFFCYPTTGTATEGFRDYILPAEMSADSELIHSRAECDLEMILDSGSAEEQPTEDHLLRIDSLRTWDTPIIMSTADLVLGIVSNSRRSLFSFPSIANGAFVFDEIHQYDDELFGCLLRFIEAFRGAPILLMTASLPRLRLDALADTVEKTGRSLRVIAGPPELETRHRYRMLGIAEEPPWDLIKSTLDNGGKVLWVCNTVNRARTFVRHADDRNLSVLPYHSRYKYIDRLERHNAVIDAFKREGPALAITTQVCEVSLDISASLLISDMAPIPALIQRMGRLNRKGDLGTGEAVFLRPPSARPYLRSEYNGAVIEEWIWSLQGRNVSQADLAHAFEQFMQDAQVQRRQAHWIDEMLSRQTPIREASPTIPVILADDRSRCVDPNGRPDSKAITRLTIPMTMPWQIPLNEFRRIGFSFLAPAGAIAYSPATGAEWTSEHPLHLDGGN